MTPERWAAIERVLDATLELPTSERVAFLEQACGSDEDFRFHVEEALAAMIQPENNPFGGTIRDVAAQFVQESSLQGGARLGAYRVLEEIGRGGMGSVYLAERADDEFHKRVAIKVVKQGTATAHSLSRFRQERRILARLDHPYIARIIDGGSTAEGLPYLVMDYIQGQPIDEYCEQHKLSLAERLNLFRRVCEAVAYAHQNLVVHRDLKPSNILVDESGAPRLLDFGIAKLLDHDTGDAHVSLTVDSMRLLTPRYASPEQVLGEPITTASDIYSLGTVLYELLTAAPAHRITSMDPASLIRAVCEENATMPSKAARTGVSPVPAQRLTGDLDNILLTALRKDPRLRYRSVEQFSDDLGQFLEYRPVRARPLTARYRVAKFVRRNFATVIAAVVAVALLIAGVAISTYQARRAERRFLQVRKLANTFLFDIHDLLEGVAGTTLAKEAMVRTALEYLDVLSRESGRDAALQWELAAAYQRIGDLQGYSVHPNLGRIDAALDSHRKSLGIAQQLAASDGTPRNQRLLAQEYQRTGYLQAALGSTAAGRDSMLRGLQVAEALADSAPGDPANAQLLLGMHLSVSELERSIGNTAEFIRHNLRTVEVAQRWFDQNPDERARSAVAVGHGRASLALAAAGDMDGALAHSREEIRIREDEAAARAGDTNLQRQLMNAYEQYASVLFQGDKLSLEDRAASIPYFAKTLTIAERLSAADRNNVGAQSDLVIARRNSCWAMVETDPSGAFEICRQGLELMDRTTGIQERYRGRLLAAAGVAQERLNKREPARSYLAQSIEVFQKVGSRDPSVLEYRQDLLRAQGLTGVLLLEMGRRDTALEHLQSALAAAEELVAGKPADLLRRHDVADCYENLGNYYRKGDRRQARDWYQKSLEVWTAWPRSAPSTRLDQTHRERAARLVAECDSALAKDGRAGR